LRQIGQQPSELSSRLEALRTWMRSRQSDDNPRREQELPLPAMLCSTVVLPGQRAAVAVAGTAAEKAVQAARRARSPLVLLPALDDLPLEMVRIAALVDIDDIALREAAELSVFGRAAAEVRLVSRSGYLQVMATERRRWPGTNAWYLAQVETVAARIRRRAELVVPREDFRARTYDALGIGQLVVTLAHACMNEPAERYQLLGADLLQQLLLLDQVLMRRMERRRSTRRRLQRQPSRVAAPTPTQLGARLSDEVRQAIVEERSRRTGDSGETGEEAVRFIEGMQWVAPEPEPIDLAGARAKLDEVCYGLEAVKERVLDLLAAREWSRRRGAGAESSGKVLCLVGPPGVGKTSIAAVIAEAMGRELVRIPMGGVDDIFLAGSDQAYRRARPGEIARRIRQTGKHPSALVFLFDEIDKVPANDRSAVPVLLNLLDPEQQAEFRDHFLDAVAIDLSRSLFICTANNLDDITPPLRDRLQPLIIPGYSTEEQVRIGTEHLLPRLREKLAIDGEVNLTGGVVEALVARSPASPGMRQLKGQLETVLTRGLRRFLESEMRTVVSVDEALQWAAGNREAPRRIGFQKEPAREVGDEELMHLRANPIDG